MNKRGFTIFFASLVGSLALAVGIAIFELTIRELDLSQTTTQSQLAIYAADAGAECALYWDNNYTGNYSESAFATSTSYSGAGANSSLSCNSMDITSPTASYDNSQRGANAATTTFTLLFTLQGKSTCAKVTVAKVGSPAATVLTSRGYNTCTAGAPLQLERSLRLIY